MSYFNSPDYVAYIKKYCDFKEDRQLVEGQGCTRPDLEIIRDYIDCMETTPASRLLEVG